MSLPVIERARRYIAKCPPAISGKGGHDATFHVAAVLVHGFDLSEGDALMVIQGWNSFCLPPWSEADLIHKIKSARAATHASHRGHLLGNRRSSGSGSPAKREKAIAVAPPPAKPVFCPMVLKRIAGKVRGVVRPLTHWSLLCASPHQ